MTRRMLNHLYLMAFLVGGTILLLWFVTGDASGQTVGVTESVTATLKPFFWEQAVSEMRAGFGVRWLVLILTLAASVLLFVLVNEWEKRMAQRAGDLSDTGENTNGSGTADNRE